MLLAKLKRTDDTEDHQLAGANEYDADTPGEPQPSLSWRGLGRVRHSMVNAIYDDWLEPWGNPY